MNSKFNVKRYLELISKETIYSQQNKVFFEENKNAFMELLNYRADVVCQISYKRKNIYFSLVQKYLTEQISIDQFMTDFLDLQDKDSKDAAKVLNDFKKLSTFLIFSEAIQFSSLLLDIFNCSMGVIEEDALSDTEFRESIERVFHQMKKYCNS